MGYGSQYDHKNLVNLISVSFIYLENETKQIVDKEIGLLNKQVNLSIVVSAGYQTDHRKY